MAAATQRQIRRGTAAQINAFTPAQGEVVFDETNNRLVVGDGVKAGGYPAPTLDLLNGHVNKFRNSNFDVAQRGTSGSVGAGTTAYTLDGWMISATGAALSWVQSFNSGMYGSGAQLNCASGLTAASIKQRIESAVAAQLLPAPRTATGNITVQFAIYNASGATITPTIATNCANARDDFSAVTADLVATNLQPCPNNALTVVSYTFTPSLNLVNGYEVILSFGAGLNAASGSVVVGEADIRSTPSVAVGPNANPPPAEMRPASTEAAFCQRYYFRRSSTGTQDVLITAQAYSTAAVVSGEYRWPAPLRASPTSVNLSSLGHLSAFTAGGGTSSAFSVGPGIGNANQYGCYFNIGGTSGLIAGNATVLFFNSSSAYVEAIAEL